MFAFKYLRSLSSVLYRRGFPWLWNRTEINRGAAPYRELLKRRLSYKAGRKNTRNGRLPSWKSIGPGIAISEILLNWNYPNMNRPDSIFPRYFIKHLYVVNRYPDYWKYGEKKKCLANGNVFMIDDGGDDWHNVVRWWTDETNCDE